MTGPRSDLDPAAPGSTGAPASTGAGPGTAQDGGVPSVDLARALRDAGLQWTPARGDRFVMPDRGMDSDVFVLSDMTIEVHSFPAGPVIGFNGTTEWALDSVDDTDALWLPRESQLRALLGGTFVSLERVDGRWRVTISVTGSRSAHEHEAAEEAYALALLELVTASAT